MKLVRPRRQYESLEAFYAELPDVDRRLSPESDFGVHWTYPWERGWWPKYRVSFVHHTGELIIVRLAHRHDGPVEVVAVFEDRDECEWALEGWAEHCGRGGLGWLIGRLEHCVPNYICGHCLFYVPSKAPTTFDDTVPCRRCGRLAWGETETSARERRRRPAEEACS